MAMPCDGYSLTYCNKLNENYSESSYFQPNGVVIIDIAIGAGGVGFYSMSSQLEHSVANGSRRFFGGVLSRR